jgi:hypothetical protein
MKKRTALIVLSILISILCISGISTSAYASVPPVTTAGSSSITSSSAVINGSVNGNGGYAIVEYGFYYGTSSIPGTKVIAGTSHSTPFSFNKTLSGLQPNTRYYYQAYAKNSNGEIGRAQVLNFLTTGTIIPVTSVSLKSSTSINVGYSETLIATVLPSNATNKTVSWKSSNSAVASVSSTGKITGKAIGTAVITVTTNNGKTASCSVKVIRSASVYNAAVKKLNVLVNYCPSGGTTYCNVFAYDLSKAMMAPLPYKNANGMADWLSVYGAINGWKKVDYKTAQMRANSGYPTFVVKKESVHGHIAAVVPWREDHSTVTNPWHYVYIAQAGSVCYEYKTISYGWAATKVGSISNLSFYTHN